MWVGDITYIPLLARNGNGRFGYLAWTCGRGGSWARNMEEGMVLGALRRAIQKRWPGPELIHHTDRGGQYAGQRYREVLQRGGTRQSMTAAGSYYDNAFMESFLRTVKTELEQVEYGEDPEAVREISEYIQYYT